MSICKLCKKDRPLRNSHVIPAFVARWLRKTSATGNLRSSRQPNQLVQDTRKLPMLCHECEQRFGAWEAKFARCIFLPRHAGTSAAGNYGPWLRLFLASIAWRVATVQIANHTQVGSNYNNAAQSLEHWRRFLLDETTNFEEYTIHLLFLNATTLTSESLPKYYNHFLLRTTGYRLIVQPRVLAVLVKLPGMVVWLPILPRKPRGWVVARTTARDWRIERWLQLLRWLAKVARNRMVDRRPR